MLPGPVVRALRTCTADRGEPAARAGVRVAAIARKHVDIDLLTRGAGFGYLGSTVTSLVYATYTLIFLAYGGAIMGQAVTVLTGLDLHWSYVAVSLVMIPLTLWGMVFSARFQAWTWPLWVVLIGLAVVTAATATEVAAAAAALPGVQSGVEALYAIPAARYADPALRFRAEVEDVSW